MTSLNPSNFLEMQKITAYQHETHVLDDFNLTIGAEEKVAILGPNGAGKSTLLKLISREIYPVRKADSYLRIFGGEDFTLWDLRSKMGFVSLDLQEDFTPFTTAIDVIVTGFFGSLGTHAHLVPTAEQVSLAHDLLNLVGLSEDAQTMFQRLSTGQKRRLLLARSLVHSPTALVLDEPTSGLDIAGSIDLMNLLSQFCQQHKALMITTHHLDEIIPEIDRVILLKAGNIIADGKKKMVLTSENLSRLYDCELEVVENNGWYRFWH